MDTSLRDSIPQSKAELEEFFRKVESSAYDERDEFFGLNYSAQRVLSNFVWDVHSYNAYLFYAKCKAPKQKPPLSEVGLHIGHLSEEQTELLREIFASCQEQTFDAFRFHSGYLFEPRQSVNDLMGRINRYFTPSEKLLADLPKIIEPLSDDIERLCGHFWRVCAVRIFSVRPVSATQSLHTDGWPLGIKKLYFYPNGVNRELGSTQVIDKLGRDVIAEGGPGTWMLFENSVVMHQALPNATQDRPTIEIILVPAFHTDTRLIVTGSNGMFPFYPYEAPVGDESVLPDEFRFSEVEYRARKRTAGLATALPIGDHSLGLDEFIGVPPVSASSVYETASPPKSGLATTSLVKRVMRRMFAGRDTT